MDNVNKIGKLILKEFAEKVTVNIAFVVNVKALANSISIDEHYVLLELQRLYTDKYIGLKADGYNWIITLYQDGLNAGKKEVQEWALPDIPIRHFQRQCIW